MAALFIFVILDLVKMDHISAAFPYMPSGCPYCISNDPQLGK